jgi:antitoxin component YwqK of YwqJK toxin-antitoxin module
VKTLAVWCAGLALLASATARADVIWVNGKKWDDRYGKPENLTGYLEYRDEHDQVRSREQWVNGEKDGPYVHFDLFSCKGECKPDETGTFRHGKVDGVRRRYRNGALESEYSYVAGKVIGVQKEYDNGALSRVFLTNAAESRVTEMSFNKKGQLVQLSCGAQAIGKQDAEWCGLRGKQSTVTIYSADGAVSETEQYLWGKRHGTMKKFNVRTAKLMREEQYKSGLLDGTSKHYDAETGKVLEEEQWEAGKPLKGGQKRFTKEGGLLAKTDCDEPRTSCTETLFFENGGQPRTMTSWKKGKTVARKEFFQNGKVSEDLRLEGDRYQIDEYSDTGKLVSKGTYVEANDWYWRPYVPDGVVERYDEDGTLAEKRTFKAGVRQGKAVSYWTEKGHKVREEAEWEKDAMKTQELYVDDKVTDRFEYFPDGSLKTHQSVAASPLTKT